MHWDNATLEVARRHRAAGWTTEQIAIEMNAPSSAAVRGAIRRAIRASMPAVIALPKADGSAVQQSGGHGCRVRRSASPAAWGFALGDLHVPFHDKKALDLVSFVMEDVRGDGDPELVQVGDYTDQGEVSRHAKDPDTAVSLDFEFKVGREVRARLDSLRSWRKKTITKGNHDIRVRKYILENAPAVRNMIPSFEALLEMPQNGWDVVDYGEVYKFGDLHVTHDLDTAGMYAHVRSAAKMGGSTLIGHTHRIAMTCSGNHAHGPWTAAMIGWLGNFEFAQYIKRPLRAEWRHGFGLLHVDPSGHTHVTPVEIAGGRCIVHGKLYDLAQLARRKAA